MGEFTASCRELCCSLCAVAGDFVFVLLPQQLKELKLNSCTMLLKSCWGEACDAHVAMGVLF